MPYGTNCTGQMRFTHGKVYEDIDIQYKLFYASNNFLVCPYTLYNYVAREGSITSQSTLENAIDFFDAHASRFLHLPFGNERIYGHALRHIFSAYTNFIYLTYKTFKYNACYKKYKRMCIEDAMHRIYPRMKTYLSKTKCIVVFLLLQNNRFFDLSFVMLKFLWGKYTHLKHLASEMANFKSKISPQISQEK